MYLEHTTGYKIFYILLPVKRKSVKKSKRHGRVITTPILFSAGFGFPCRFGGRLC
jgi:hypothetical protein